METLLGREEGDTLGRGAERMGDGGGMLGGVAIVKDTFQLNREQSINLSTARSSSHSYFYASVITFN